MKIELKSIVFSERMSEETNAFTADLFVNGKKLCFVRDNGQGGCIDYQVHDFKNYDLLNEVETYCRLLPPIQYGGTSLDNNLEMVIGELFEKWLGEKELKKLEKKFIKSLCYGTPNRYTMLTWGKKTIAELLNDSVGRVMLQKKITQLKQDGETILNTNIPSEMLI
jgi:hypothetical protein